MANPSGRTFHYSAQRLNEPGYPAIIRDDGSRAESVPQRASDFLGGVGGMLRDNPLPVFLGAVALGFLAGSLLSKG